MRFVYDCERPPYKCEVEYLESTGTQWIDTGIVGTQNIGIELSLTATQINTKIFGCRTSTSSNNISIFYGSSADSRLGIDFNNSNYATYRCQYATLNQRVIIKADKNNRKIISTSGSVLAENNTVCTDTILTPDTLKLFDITNGFQESLFVGYLYYCKIYDNNTLVRDFIPVLDWDMTPCMYDKVSKTLFYNAGTGNFTAGRRIIPVEYLESTGTQYIDTGYIPTKNTSFDLYGINMDYHSGTTRFGSRVGLTAENYCFTAIAANALRFVYGNGSTTASMEYVYSTQKLAKLVQFNASTKICTVTFNDDTTESSSVFNTTPLTSSAKSLYLFAFNNNDTPTFGISKQTELKIYESGVLVRDYIPAIDENGVAFMYDRVYGVIYDNAGTGSFLYGKNVQPKKIMFSYTKNNLLTKLRFFGD